MQSWSIGIVIVYGSKDKLMGQEKILGQEIIAKHSNSPVQDAGTVYTSQEAMSYLMGQENYVRQENLVIV